MTNTKLTVALSNDFFKAYGNLPAKAQNKVAAFIGKFRDNPRSPGLNYEHIEGGRLINPIMRVDQEIDASSRPDQAAPCCCGSPNTTTPINGHAAKPAMSIASQVRCR